MRQTLINAALFMAYPMGIRQKAWDIEAKSSKNISSLLTDVSQYVSVAVDMVEAAQEMAMSIPHDPNIYVYQSFGSSYAAYIKEHNEVPEREVALQTLREHVQTCFSDALSNTQRDLLIKKLKEFD